jgi:hypothetical protein
MIAKPLDPPKLPHGEGKRPPLTDEARSASMRARLARIEAKMASDKLIDDENDRRRIGLNVWHVLQKVQELDRSIRKQDVLRVAKIGHGNASTKALDTYAINPESSEETQRDRARRLAKKIRRYADIARAAARLCKKEADFFIPQLVEGTSYALLSHEWRIGRDEARESAWTLVVEMIANAARQASERHDLENLFKRITEAGIEWSFGVPGDGKRSRYKATQDEALPLLVDDNDLPPCPSLHLGRIVETAHIPCQLEFNLFLDDHEGLKPTYQQLVRQGLESGSLEAHAVIGLLVSLALIPRGDTGHVEPVFRLSPIADFIADEAFEGFAKAKFKKRTIQLPIPVKIGDVVGRCWSPLSDEDVFVDSGPNMVDDWPLYFAAYDGAIEEAIYLNVVADFSRADLDGGYAQTTHSLIPSGGSMLIPAEQGSQYLHHRIADIGWERPFCTYVYGLLDGLPNILRVNEQLAEPIFEEGTMLAAIERSFDSAPAGARLDDALAAAAEKFQNEAEAVLKRYDDAGRAEHQRLRGRLEKLEALKDQLAEKSSQRRRESRSLRS